MRLTDEQSTAVNLFKSSRSLKISAFAGTGKTSTLTALAKATPDSGLYLAFNKSIADEARSKFPKSVDCKTTHSLAFRAVPDIYRGKSSKLTQSLHGNQVAQLLEIEEIAVGGISLKPRSLGFLTAKTVQRFCQSGDELLRVDHVPLSGKLQRIDAKYQAQFKAYISDLAAHLWARMLEPGDPAPLGHDGYLKLWSLSKPALDYDFILLDEAQDTNEAVLSVLRLQSSHLTLVGDRHQQIYGWRGAINAMESMEMGAEATLTRSFRFGDSVADAATSILKTLGEKRRVIGDPTKSTEIAASGRTRTVLCRTNAGVVYVVVAALSEGRRPHVVGGVADLIRLLEDVSKLKRSLPAESAEFLGFRDWEDVIDFSGSEEGEALRSFVKLVQAYGEVKLIQQLTSVAREESSADLIVSTGHKAKGREWDSVTLHSDFEPRLDKSSPPKVVLNAEEARLLYVAATRARELLVVPTRLAEKWNVPPAPIAAVSARPIPPPPPPLNHHSSKPKLPSFAQVVPPPDGTKSARVDRFPAEPGLVKNGTTSAIPPPRPADKPNSSPVAPVHHKPATGLLASVLSIFLGKK